MAKNIEIKASLNDVKFCLDKAKSLSGNLPELMQALYYALVNPTPDCAK